MRFHFRRGKPQKVRYFADCPATVNDQYKLIYDDAGWEDVAEEAGWHLWRAVYKGDQRPEAFNDPEPLIERNNRITVVLIACTATFASVVPAISSSQLVRETVVGKVLISLFVVLLLVMVACLSAVYRQNQRLKARKP